MGVLRNIGRSVKEIGSGLKNIVTGDKRSLEQKQNAKIPQTNYGGVVPARDTKGNVVKTPTGAVVPAKVQPTVNKGGSRGGGGSSSPIVNQGTNQPTITNSNNPTISTTTNSPNRLPSSNQGNYQQATMVALSSSGVVTYGGQTYSGNAYIKRLGMTANEYNRQLREEALKSGEVTKKNIGRVSFKGNIPASSETLDSGETILYDTKGNAIGVEADLGYGMKSYSISDYNKEIKRLETIQPKQKYINPRTGQMYNEPQSVKIGNLELTSTPSKVYINPKTNKPIEDIQDYARQNRLPLQVQEVRQINTPEEFINKISEAKTYDIKSFSSRYASEVPSQGINIGENWIPSSKAYGYVSEVTPTDVFTLVGGGLALSKLPLSSLTGYLSSSVTIKGFKKLDETLLPQPTSIKGRFIKGVGEGIVFSSIGGGAGKFITGAFVGDISKNLINSPIETTKEIFTSPETYGFLLGGKLLERRVTVKPLRNIQTPEFIEKQVPYIKGGKEFKLSTYDIVGEVSPPKIKITSTRLRELFGMPPKDFEILPAEKFRVKTLEPAINQNPFLVGEVRQGSNIMRISKIEGSSFEVNPKTQTMLNIDKYLFKQYAEQLAGRPISEVSKFFEKESRFEVSDIIQTKRARLNRPRGELTLFSNEFKNLDLGKLKLRSGKGRTEVYNRALTRVKELYQTNDIEVLTSETTFKDVGKPFSRSYGQSPQLKGTIFIKKEPVILDSEPVNFIKPAEITKTPFSRTFQLSKQVSPLTKLLPRDILKTLKEGSPTITRNIKNPLSSLYYGKGLYERAFGEMIPSVSAKSFEVSHISNQNMNNVMKSSLYSLPEVKSIQINYLGLKPEVRQVPSYRQIPILKQELAMKEILSEKLIEKQAQKLEQKQIQKQLQKSAYKDVFISKLIIKNKYPIKFPVPSDSERKKLKGKKGRYQTEVRRKGKFEKVGISENILKADLLGKKTTLKELSASYQLRDRATGKLIKPLLSPYFRSSKRNKNIAVQKEFGLGNFRGRLTTQSERRLIKRSKKNRGMID